MSKSSEQRPDIFDLGLGWFRIGLAVPAQRMSARLEGDSGDQKKKRDFGHVPLGLCWGMIGREVSCLR
jgi:hypothetical protein